MKSFYRAGQWQLVWWKFRRHKLAQIAMVVLGIFYFIVIFDEFVAPYDPQKRFKDFSTLAPVSVHIIDAQGNIHLPFVYELKRSARSGDLATGVQRGYTPTIYPIGLFVQGDEYELWGLIPGISISLG